MVDSASLPPKSAPIWSDIASGKITKSWELLALKIMMTRIANDVKKDPSLANVQKLAEEIHAFFEKNIAIAQKDLSSLLG